MRVSGMMVALGCGAVVVALAGGYGAGRLFAPSAAPEITGSVAIPPKAQKPDKSEALQKAFEAAAGAPASAAAPALPKAPPVAPVASTCRSGTLGVARVVEIDTTGGPGFGFEQFKSIDFLRDKEIVLTFDDGPWPVNTPAVLKALADQCTKGLFFPIGKHAMWHPEILKQVAAGGHTIGSHTWGHVDLAKKQPQEFRDEIEKGFSAVRAAVGADISPFFRFPMLKLPPDAIAYLGERNIGIFSIDVDSFDFKTKKTEDVIKNVMSKLEKKGKGIVLMHDLQKSTARALPQLLAELNTAGYRVVQIKAAKPLATLPEYDAPIMAELKGGAGGAGGANGRSIEGIVRTVSEAAPR